MPSKMGTALTNQGYRKSRTNNQKNPSLNRKQTWFFIQSTSHLHRSTRQKWLSVRLNYQTTHTPWS